ncbi:MAG: hypothetical protein ACRDAU_15535 [Clostridium sp.]
MLTLKELKVIKEMPKEEDITLELLAKFYDKYISNRIYEVETIDNKVLTFKVENKHFPHLIGLHKFVDKTKKHKNKLVHYNRELKSTKGFINIKNSKITLNDLKLVGYKSKTYKAYKKRILNMPFTYQLLRKSKFLSYDKNLVGKDTRINGNYIFVDNINKDKLHFFFIENLELGDQIVPITFIVTKATDFNFINNQEILTIKRVTIKNFSGDKILEEYIHEEVDNNVVRE